MKENLWLGICLCLVVATGCAGSLEKQMQATVKHAGDTKHNDVYVAGMRTTDPFGQEMMGYQFWLESKEKDLAYQRTSYIPAQFQPQPTTAFQPPKRSPRGEKSNLCPPTASPPTQPLMTAVTEVGYYPRTTPLGGNGGTSAGTFKFWMGQILGNPGPYNALIPGMKVSGVGTGYGGGAGQGGTGQGGAGGAGGSAWQQQQQQQLQQQQMMQQQQQ